MNREIKTMKQQERSKREIEMYRESVKKNFARKITTKISIKLSFVYS
jgi:hypothetical protein